MNPPPRHIAVIMDGNGRWAAERNLKRSEGHRAGVQAIEPVVRTCSDMGVKTLTLFAFSTENWSRPSGEVGALMMLFSEFFRSKLGDLLANGVKIRLIGDRETMPAPQRVMAEQAEKLSEKNGGLLLQIAFNYGGRREIVAAARKIAQRAANGQIDPASISDADFEECLYSAIPVDLVIRTSGEMRMSNFLLYQCAYAEFAFAPEYWPDFSPDCLRREIAAYQNRRRRFGGLDEEE